MTDRTYSEKEVAVLLERAAELQVQAARRADHRLGLTLDELESIASEAGLDPSLLRQAANELDQPQHSLLRRNSGQTAIHAFVERRVPGELTPEVWEDIVAELRHHFESDLAGMMGMPQYGVGTTEQIGRSVQWRHMSMSGLETKVLIRPREDELDIRLSQRVGWSGAPTEGTTYGIILAVAAGLVSGAILNSSIIGGTVFVIALLTAIPLVIFFDMAWRKKKVRELETLADRLSSIVPAPRATTATESHTSVSNTEDVAGTPTASGVSAGGLVTSPTNAGSEAKATAQASSPTAEATPPLPASTVSTDPARIDDALSDDSEEAAGISTPRRIQSRRA